MRRTFLQQTLLVALIVGPVLPLAGQGPLINRAGIPPVANELLGEAPMPFRRHLADSVVRDSRTTGAVVGAGLFTGMVILLAESFPGQWKTTPESVGMFVGGGAIAALSGALIGSLFPKE